MNLREYMSTHQGRYTLAESTTPLTAHMFADEMLREEIVEYRVGQGAGGRSKLHLYVRNTVHIATLIDDTPSSQRELSYPQDSRSVAGKR